MASEGVAHPKLMLAVLLAIGLPAPAAPQQAANPRVCSVTRHGDASTGFDSRSWLDRLRRGDTAGVAREIAQEGLFCPVETATLNVLLPFLDDSVKSAALGLGDLPYEYIIRKLAEYPAVLASDTGGISCTPDACALLANQWQRAKDSRLRDVGLVALLMTDPARWADAVLRRAGEGDALLAEPAASIRGVFSSSIGAMPMPSAKADWLEWLRWARGNELADPPGAPPNLGVWADARLTAVRFFQLRTGRDFVAEWRADLRAAPNDTARYLFESLLAPMRGWDPPPMRVLEAQLRTGDALTYARAEVGIAEIFRRNVRPADTRIVAGVIDTVLAAIVDGKPLWTALPLRWDPDASHSWPNRARPLTMTLVGQPSLAVYGRVTALSGAVRQRWNDRITWVQDSTWQAPGDRSPAAMIDIGEIEAAGPFLKVRWNVYTYPNDQKLQVSPLVEYLLMRTAAGWIIVPYSAWN